MTEFIQASLPTGEIIHVPASPAISAAALQAAVVWNPARLIVVYDEAAQLGAVLLPGAPVWNCWTPIERETFFDLVNVCTIEASSTKKLAH
jgi:hypothetical protein